MDCEVNNLHSGRKVLSAPQSSQIFSLCHSNGGRGPVLALFSTTFEGQGDFMYECCIYTSRKTYLKDFSALLQARVMWGTIPSEHHLQH